LSYIKVWESEKALLQKLKKNLKYVSGTKILSYAKTLKCKGLMYLIYDVLNRCWSMGLYYSMFLCILWYSSIYIIYNSISNSIFKSSRLHLLVLISIYITIAHLLCLCFVNSFNTWQKVREIQWI